MIQLKAYADSAKSSHTYIDLYEESPIKLNFSIEDITNAEAKSIFSRTFRVPGTAANNEYFKFAFMIESTDFDVTVKKPAEILVDGAEFRQGHIRLQKIYRNEKKDRYDYELLFLGETRDFSSAIGSASLCDLNLGGLTHNLSTTNVETSWKAYPSNKDWQGNTITPGFNQGLQLEDPYGNTTYGDVVWPLVDFGNIYPLSNSNPRIATGESHDFTNNALPLSRLKPIVRAKALVDAIFASTEYSYAPGGFFDSDLFKQVYVSAWGNDASVELAAGGANTFRATSSGGAQNRDAQLIAENEVSDPGDNYNYFTYEYTVPIEGTYGFTASFYYSGSNPTTGDRPEAQCQLQQRINGGTWTDIGTAGAWVGNGTSTANATVTYTASQVTTGTGVQIRGYVYGQDQAATESFSSVVFESVVAPGPVYISNNFNCEYKQIDLIKDILTTFRLVMAPSIEDPTQFIIEPWVEYVATGDVYDWSSKLDRSQDIVLEPLFDTQTDEIDFTHTEDKDYINEYHLNAYKDPYGYLEFDSGNELLTGTRAIKTNWAPTPVSQLEGAASTNSFILPLVHTHNNDGEHEPIKAKTRFIFYNGLQSVDGNSWRLENGTGYDTQNYYPMISNTSEWPMTSSGIVLNWYNDVGYWGGGVTGFPTQFGQSMYDAYWNGYIQSLYNKQARRMTATFILNNVDLQDFSFDDVIFVDGHYWRPEKIIDAPIGQLAPVKVQLIKLLNYIRP